MHKKNVYQPTRLLMRQLLMRQLIEASERRNVSVRVGSLHRNSEQFSSQNVWSAIESTCMMTKQKLTSCGCNLSINHAPVCGGLREKHQVGSHNNTALSLNTPLRNKQINNLHELGEGLNVYSKSDMLVRFVFVMISASKCPISQFIENMFIPTTL